MIWVHGAARIQLRRQQTLPHLGFGTGRPGGSREPEATELELDAIWIYI